MSIRWSQGGASTYRAAEREDHDIDPFLKVQRCGFDLGQF
jgi:hypothetical protein